MKDEKIHIKFENQKNPKSDFELLRLDDLVQIRDADHFMYKQHLVEFYIILFITKGSGKHMLDFTDYPCNKGTVLTLRKNQFHKFYKQEALNGYLLFFKDEFIYKYLEFSESQKTLQLFNEALESPKLQLSESEYKEILITINQLKKEYNTVNDHYSLDIIRSELHVLIVKLLRFKSKKKGIDIQRKYLSEFIEFQNLVETNAEDIYKVKDYAHRMGVSTKTLNTISKTIIYKTAKEFIDEIRIIKIKRLLINTDHSIKEISFDSGFNDSTNFYNFFKRHTNKTPDAFRSEFI